MTPTTSLVVRSCCALALLAAVVALAGRAAQRAPAPAPATAARLDALDERTPCPRGTLPDDGVCLPVPVAEAASPGAQAAEAPAIELLPDRPESYLSYELPVAATAFDAEGTAVLLRTTARAEVRAIALEQQEGPASWLESPSPAARALTLHTVRRGDSVRRCVVALEPVKLRSPARSSLPPQTVIGETQTSGLRLSVRQLRQTTDPTLPAEQLLTDANSIACDPRNVLVRRSP